MSTSGLKAIAPVPTAADFLDIVLSKTQRKTPTVRCYKIHGSQDMDKNVVLEDFGFSYNAALGYSQELQNQSDKEFLHAQSEVRSGLLRGEVGCYLD